MGDNEFLCNTYGISGASGMLIDNTKFYIEIKIEVYIGITMEIFHFKKMFLRLLKDVLWFFYTLFFFQVVIAFFFVLQQKIIFKSISNIPKKRSLATLDKSLEMFVEFGCDLNRAKECNKVINQRIFNIPLNQVCRAQFVKYT